MTTSNAQDSVGGKNTQEKLPVNTYRTSRQDKNTAHKTSRTKRWTKRKKAPVFHFCADTGIASRGENKDHERRPFSPPLHRPLACLGGSSICTSRSLRFAASSIIQAPLSSPSVPDLTPHLLLLPSELPSSFLCFFPSLLLL
jgi:hypothetical protein